MMTETFPMRAASPLLAAELWTSFASLLRSHVAMRSIARPEAKLRIGAGSDAVLELLGTYGKLTIVAPDASGICATELRPEAGELGDEYSGFFFTEDGLIHLDSAQETGLEMETAVELLLGKVIE